MRDGILKLLIACMLFVSMEGTADAVDALSFHQTHHAHVNDSGNQWFPDSDGDDHESDACEHFCHAHSVGLTGQLVLANVPRYRIYVPVPPARTLTHSIAPPTPPPNL
jgi:hypothetical protein